MKVYFGRFRISSEQEVNKCSCLSPIKNIDLCGKTIYLDKQAYSCKFDKQLKWERPLKPT